MRLRMGDSDSAIATYLEHGRVTVTPTGLDARLRLVEGWMEARSTQTSVMLASRLADVDTLNRSARHRLQHAGVIGADEVAIGGRGFSAGDLVLASRNDNWLDVLNGTRTVIETIDPERQVIRCRTDDPAHSPWRSNMEHRATGSRRSPRTSVSTSDRDPFASLGDTRGP